MDGSGNAVFEGPRGRMHERVSSKEPSMHGIVNASAGLDIPRSLFSTGKKELSVF